MDYGIRLADIGKELISETLAFRRTFDKTCNVDDLDSCRNNRPGITHLHKLIETVIGYGDHAYIRLDSTEWKVSRLRLGVRQTVEKSGFTHIRQAHYTAL